MSILTNIIVCVITIALLASFKLLIPVMVRAKGKKRSEMENKMRCATAEEVKAVSDYIESISHPTGTRFSD